MVSVDVIVQLDACFKHKRRRHKGEDQDPSHVHPETVFLSKEDVSSMEEYVDTVRPQKDTKTRKAAQQPDGYI